MNNVSKRIVWHRVMVLAILALMLSVGCDRIKECEYEPAPLGSLSTKGGKYDLRIVNLSSREIKQIYKYTKSHHHSGRTEWIFPCPLKLIGVLDSVPGNSMRYSELSCCNVAHMESVMLKVLFSSGEERSISFGPADMIVDELIVNPDMTLDVRQTNSYTW